MKVRLSRIAGVAFAAAAIAAPGAGAYVANGDGGSSGAQVVLNEGNGVGAQRVEGSGGSSAAVVTREEQNDFAWYSFVVAMSLLAALGATGAALTHRRSHRAHATLSL